MVTGIAPAAMDDTHRSTEPHISVATSQEPGAELQLEVREAPLAQVLNEIAVKSKIPIHYSILPDGLVTATCVGPNVKKVLDCLIGARVDLVYRYIRDTKQVQPPPVAEVWLLGTNIGVTQVSAANCPALVSQASEIKPPAEPVANLPTEPSQEAIEQSARLLEQAKAKDPGQRAEAIYNLGLAGLKDDHNVSEALRTALTDKDPNVRAQAATSIAQRGGDEMTASMTEALKDRDVNVRFAAVSSINDDAGLLQLASQDGDKMVRDLAANKLTDLAARQGK